jgi:F-box/leucine-rich repeat protein 17
MQEERIVPKCSAENHQKMHVNHHETGILFDFSQLPWVVFLTILKFFKTDELCRLCLVNKRWQKACLDPCLWRNLDLMKYHSISDDDLIRLTSYSSNVVKLNISQDVDACNLLTDLGFSQVLQQCPSLVECSIFNCRELSDDVLATLGECCHFLRKLDITLSIRFTDEGIRKVV